MEGTTPEKMRYRGGGGGGGGGGGADRSQTHHHPINWKTLYTLLGNRDREEVVSS